jgi:hypothetical protein
MVQQLLGVLMLRPQVFRAIAEDSRATRRSWGIVLAMICVTAVARAIAMTLIPDNAAPFPLEVGRWLLIQTPVNVFSWLIGSVLLQFIAQRFFGVVLDRSAVLRVFGHIRIFALVGALGAFAPGMPLWFAIVMVVVVLHIVATAAALQALGGLSRGRAIVCAAAAIVPALILAIAVLLALITLVMMTAVALGIVPGT